MDGPIHIRDNLISLLWPFTAVINESEDRFILLSIRLYDALLKLT